MKSYTLIAPSPIGYLGLSIENETITELDILPASNYFPCTNTIVTEQLNRYFENGAYRFTLNVKPNGTTFQQRVWQALTTIPAGTTLTYGQLAKQLNSSPRAIGQACRHNPIPIIIPCHRIVGATHLGGYSGKTEGTLTDIKKWLLAHENKNAGIQAT